MSGKRAERYCRLSLIIYCTVPVGVAVTVEVSQEINQQSIWSRRSFTKQLTLIDGRFILQLRWNKEVLFIIFDESFPKILDKMVRVKRKEMLKLRRMIQDIFPNNSPWTRKELSRLDRKELTSFIPSSLMESVECTGKDGRILKKDMLEFILANAEKIKNEAFVPKILTPSLLEIGGLDSVVAELNERVWLPLMTAPDAARRLGITPPNGILLHGPPGCGKSLVAVSLANLLSPDEPPVIVKGPEILDSYWGASEKNIRDLFGLDTKNDQPVSLLRMYPNLMGVTNSVTSEYSCLVLINCFFV